MRWITLSGSRMLSLGLRGLQPACPRHKQNLSTNSVVYSRLTAAFKPIENTVDKNGPEFAANQEHFSLLAKKYADSVKLAMSGGGPKAIEKHVKINQKLLATDRLNALLDNKDDFLEIGLFNGLHMKYGDIPRSGVITGIGKVQGLYCMLILNDASVKGGTMYPIAVKKQLRAQEIALQNRLPCVYVVDSGGAFLPLQAEIFPGKEHGGRCFYNEAILSSRGIPQLAIVVGNCTAGGAYVPTMTQEAIIVHRVGTIFLGGPPLVYAALGEVVSAEDLGGATMHCGTSGCTDHFAATEEEGFSLGRDVVTSFNLTPREEPSGFEEPLYDVEELEGLIPEHNQHEMDSYQVIARIVDGSRFQEFKAMFGKGLINGYAFIQGNLVGIIASNGIVDAKAALKTCHFVQLCAQRGVPLVFLQNSTPDETSPSTEEEAAADGHRMRGHASLMSAVAVADVPKFTIIMGNSFGASNYLLCGRSFSPNFLFMWPNAKTAAETPETLINGAKQMALPPNVDPSSEEYQTFEAKVLEPLKFSTSAMYSSSRGWDDGIIMPRDTRKVLGQCLNIVKQSPQNNQSQEQAVLRM